jgi:hypothetical protein
MSRPHIDQTDRDTLEDNQLIDDDHTPDLRTGE